MTHTIFSAPDAPAYFESKKGNVNADFMTAAADKLQKSLLAGDNKNHIYSPACLYLCAYILAQTAKGSCQKQIYKFLRADETTTDKLRNFVIRNNFTGTRFIRSACLVGTSLWINDRLKYSKDLLRMLRDLFKTASFGVDAKAQDSAKEMNTWIKEMTGEFLNRESESTFDSNSALTILSTVYINAGWENEFDEEDTKEGIFYAKDGEVKCQYMCGTERSKIFYGKNFSAYKKYAGMNNVWFILPEKGCTVEDVLIDGCYLKMIQDPESITHKIADVTLSVPKFDVSNEFDMVKTLYSLGVTNIFDSRTCDLSALINSDEKMCVDKFTHSVRMKIDENGIVAAALAECDVAIAGALFEPLENISFYIDRPFLFAVTGTDNSVLMSGVINDPTK